MKKQKHKTETENRKQKTQNTKQKQKTENRKQKQKKHIVFSPILLCFPSCPQENRMQ